MKWGEGGGGNDRIASEVKLHLWSTFLPRKSSQLHRNHSWISAGVKLPLLGWSVIIVRSCDDKKKKRCFFFTELVWWRFLLMLMISLWSKQSWGKVMFSIVSRCSHLVGGAVSSVIITHDALISPVSTRCHHWWWGTFYLTIIHDALDNTVECPALWTWNITVPLCW